MAKSTNTVLTGSPDDPPTLKQTTFCMDITFYHPSSVQQYFDKSARPKE
jgi:hypothetical protein